MRSTTPPVSSGAVTQRLHDRSTDPDAPSVPVARDQQVRAGDIIMSRCPDPVAIDRAGSLAGLKLCSTVAR